MTDDLNGRTSGERPHGKPRSIGEVLGRKPPAKVRRTYQPVRRNSHYRGRCEVRQKSRADGRVGDPGPKPNPASRVAADVTFYSP